MPPSIRGLPENVSEGVRRLNPELFGGVPGVPPPAVVAGVKAKASRPSPPAATPTLVRQDKGKTMNKTETLFLEHIKKQGFKFIEFEGVTYKIGNGVRFTPDFTAWDPISMRAFSWDTKGTWSNNKGHIEDDAVVKIKVAAARYPYVDFYLAWWDKEAFRWNLQHVLP